LAIITLLYIISKGIKMAEKPRRKTKMKKTKIRNIGRRGKIVLTMLVAVMFIGVASAALVPYLSNEAKAKITVDSPMLAGISLGKESWATTECWRADPGEWVLSFPEGYGHGGPIHDWDETDWTTRGTLEIPNIRGGETITIYLMSANLADAHIWGFEEAIVYNSEGVTENDFESVKVSVDSIYGDLGYGTEQELIGTGGCTQVDPWRVQFGSSGPSDWNVGETDVTKIVVTFEEAASGTYLFTYRIIPEI